MIWSVSCGVVLPSLVRHRREQRIRRRASSLGVLGLFAPSFVSSPDGRQRLRRLAAVAVERDRLEAEPPALLVDLCDVLDGGVVREVHRLRDGAAEERLRRRHHPHVAHRREEALARLAAAVRAVEDRVVLRRCRCGAPSIVMRPTMTSLASSICVAREAEVLEEREAFAPRVLLRRRRAARTSPRRGPTAANALSRSKTPGSAASTFASSASVSPFSLSVAAVDVRRREQRVRAR